MSRNAGRIYWTVSILIGLLSDNLLVAKFLACKNSGRRLQYTPSAKELKRLNPHDQRDKNVTLKSKKDEKNKNKNKRVGHLAVYGCSQRQASYDLITLNQIIDLS